MSTRRTFTCSRSRSTVMLSPSATPTTLPVKSAHAENETASARLAAKAVRNIRELVNDAALGPSRRFLCAHTCRRDSRHNIAAIPPAMTNAIPLNQTGITNP